MKLGSEFGYINPHTVIKTGSQPESALRRSHLLRLPRRTPLSAQDGSPSWPPWRSIVELVRLASPAGLAFDA